MKKGIVFLGAFVLLTVFAVKAQAHCEIPCGIYDDEARFTAMAEDIKTVEKSMNKINELAADPKANANQLVRWVQNKEVHADKISHAVTQYFLTQRVKPVSTNDKKGHKAYLVKLELLHGLMVQSMKAKQTTDLGHVEHLTTLLNDFHKAYHPDEFKN